MAKHSLDIFEHCKLRGELAELAFMYRATSEGITVAKPWGDSHHYDCLIQYKSRLLRVQVKSTFRPPQGKYKHTYKVIVARYVQGKSFYYTSDEVDFMVAFLAPCDCWYIIPIQDLPRRRAICLYPNGTRIHAGGFYEQYREAWHLLKGEQPPTDMSSTIAEISAAANRTSAFRHDELLSLVGQELQPTCGLREASRNSIPILSSG